MAKSRQKKQTKATNLKELERRRGPVIIIECFIGEFCY